jgi:hypothetical protein
MLSPCPELRELEFEMLSSSHDIKVDLDTISSIESAHIKKIIIKHRIQRKLQMDGANWAKLDSVLTKVTERLNPGNRLEVELQGGWNIGVHEFDLKTYLPRFTEKGRVKVLDSN